MTKNYTKAKDLMTKDHAKAKDQMTKDRQSTGTWEKEKKNLEDITNVSRGTEYHDGRATTCAALHTSADEDLLSLVVCGALCAVNNYRRPSVRPFKRAQKTIAPSARFSASLAQQVVESEATKMGAHKTLSDETPKNKHF